MLRDACYEIAFFSIWGTPWAGWLGRMYQPGRIVQFEPERATKTLPDLLKSPEERLRAVEVAQYIAGTINEMEPRTLEMLQRLRRVLDLPPMTGDVLADPLGDTIGAKAISEVAAE